MRELWLKPEWKPPAAAHTTIVFVHGAVVNGMEMGLLRHRLGRLGYHTRQFHYHSMVLGLDDNARSLSKFIHETKGDVVHVVGHSMGGVLLRRVFEHTPDPRPGRLVAVGSPFLDCWTGHRVSGLHKHGYCLLGKTVHDHIRHPREPAWSGARELGVIAGTYPFGIGCIFHDLPPPSDGVVLLPETRLEGIKDHFTIRMNHFGLLLSKRCCAQIARFLAVGTFAHPARPVTEVVPGFSPAATT